MAGRSVTADMSCKRIHAKYFRLVRLINDGRNAESAKACNFRYDADEVKTGWAPRRQ